MASQGKGKGSDEWTLKVALEEVRTSRGAVYERRGALLFRTTKEEALKRVSVALALAKTSEKGQPEKGS